MSTTSKELMALEALAYQLFLLENSHGSADPETSWRSNKEGRTAAKDKAKVLQGRLNAAGVSLRVSQSKRLEKFIHELITVPAHEAYDLVGEAPTPPARPADTPA